MTTSAEASYFALWSAAVHARVHAGLAERIGMHVAYLDSFSSDGSPVLSPDIDEGSGASTRYRGPFSASARGDQSACSQPLHPTTKNGSR